MGHNHTCWQTAGQSEAEQRAPASCLVRSLVVIRESHCSWHHFFLYRDVRRLVGGALLAKVWLRPLNPMYECQVLPRSNLVRGVKGSIREKYANCSALASPDTSSLLAQKFCSRQQSTSNFSSELKYDTLFRSDSPYCRQLFLGPYIP